MANSSIPPNTTFFAEVDLKLISAGSFSYVWEATVIHPLQLGDAASCGSVWLPVGAVFFIPVGQMGNERRQALDQVAAFYQRQDEERAEALSDAILAMPEEEDIPF